MSCRLMRESSWYCCHLVDALFATFGRGKKPIESSKCQSKLKQSIWHGKKDFSFDCKIGRKVNKISIELSVEMPTLGPVMC